MSLNDNKGRRHASIYLGDPPVSYGGEIVILAIGGFVLWLVGEFGDAPKWLRSRHLRKGRRAQ